LAGWRLPLLARRRICLDDRVVAGLTADIAGVSTAVLIVAAITTLSALTFDQLYVLEPERRVNSPALSERFDNLEPCNRDPAMRANNYSSGW
jgi:hypothetical protein